VTSITTDDVVLIPVGPLDRRAYDALRHGVELASGPVRAVHVSPIGEDANAFAVEWTRTGMSFSVPLEIVEADVDCASLIRAAVEHAQLEHRGVVIVVIGRLRLTRRWHRWLHDQSAEQIIDALSGLDRVRVEVVDVAL
jgi:hypothetical protein